MALRRDCGQLTCAAEAKGGRLGDLEETLAIQIGKRLGSQLGAASVFPSVPSKMGVMVVVIVLHEGGIRDHH